MQAYKIKSFANFARKESIDDATLQKALDEIREGKIDANLGGNVIKQRVARKGRGKSGGFRVIICIRLEDKAFFTYGFPKSAKDNLNENELAAVKQQAKILLNLDKSALDRLLADGSLEQLTPEDNP